MTGRNHTGGILEFLYKIGQRTDFPAEELDMLEHRLNINSRDVDLFAYNGRTPIYYAGGNQMTYSFLCEAIYDGPEAAFPESFFR